MSGIRRTVGVIGGLGPAATLDFFARVLAATPAQRDQDHLRLIIDNNPTVPDRNAAIAGRVPSPGPLLAEMARGLERSGADFLVMPCNTAYAFAADIEAAISIPLVSLIEETAGAVARTGAKQAGLLATVGALSAGLYQRAFAARGIESVVLDGAALEAFMATVYRIKATGVDAGVRAEMRIHAGALMAKGAAVLVAACTEVPLALDAADVEVTLINSTDVLVKRTIAYGFGEPLPGGNPN